MPVFTYLMYYLLLTGTVSRLNITTYNVRTLLRDEHTQELEEEFRETG